MADRPHGYARYKLDGCRCYVCGYAVAQYSDAREHAIRRGQWQPYVDAEPVRQHVRELQACELGTRRIAELAGLERKTVCTLLNGRTDRGTPPPARTRPATATAILAIEPTIDNLAPATVISGIGTHRRLQALITTGWPQCHLAAALGMTPGNFGRTLTTPDVTVRTAKAVRALYDRLWRANPAEHEASPAGITRAKKYAADRGWAPVGAWDDDTIDDPAATPQAGAGRALSRDELAAVRREEIEHLHNCGLPEHEIADRLGMAYTTVRNVVLELRSGRRRIRPTEGANAPAAAVEQAA